VRNLLNYSPGFYNPLFHFFNTAKKIKMLQNYMYIQPYSRCVCRISIIKINRYPVKLSSAVDRDRARFSVLTMKAINHQRCMSSKARRPSQQLPSLFPPLVVQYATIFVNEIIQIILALCKKCILCIYLSAASKMIPCLVIFPQVHISITQSR